MALVDRVQAVLLKPQQTWPVIAMEPDTVRNLMMTYVLPLAAIPAVCRTLGLAVFGISMPFIGHLSYGPIYLIATLILQFAVGVASVFILAQIIDALAPTFGSMKNPVQAMKVATYSYIPSAVAGVFGLFPLAGVLGLLGAIYGIFQIYWGLRSTMMSPQDKAIGFTAVAIILAVIVLIILGFIVNLIVAPLGPAITIPHTYTTTP